jgi:hypothetical protein
MDGLDAEPARAMCSRCEEIYGATQQRHSISWSELLAVATATAVLISGLNGLLQIMKIVIECGYAHRG